MNNFRVGTAYDIHRLGNGQGITLANHFIPCQKKIIAHSDGDLIIHTLIDCILGALALGNIGDFFPDNQIQYKNISSSKLLAEILNHHTVKQWQIANFDCTIILQEPKLKKQILLMRQSLARLLALDVNCISIKATTYENLDSLGRGEAIACQAIILLYR